MALDDALEPWLRLSLTPGLGDESFRRLLVAFGSPEAIVSASVRDLVRVVPHKVASGIERGPSPESMACVAAWLEDEANAIVTLGDVRYPDMVAEVADFLLRLDAVEWAMAIACYNKYLYVSVRTTDRNTNAGELLRKVLGSRSAGGHDLIAGGRVRIEDGGIGREKAAVTVKDRLLKALNIDTTSCEHLVR